MVDVTAPEQATDGPIHLGAHPIVKRHGGGRVPGAKRGEELAVVESGTRRGGRQGDRDLECVDRFVALPTLRSDSEPDASSSPAHDA